MGRIFGCFFYISILYLFMLSLDRYIVIFYLLCYRFMVILIRIVVILLMIWIILVFFILIFFVVLVDFCGYVSFYGCME